MRFGPPQLAAFPVPKSLLGEPHTTCDSDESVAALYGVDAVSVAEAFARSFEEDGAGASHKLGQPGLIDKESQ